MSSFEPALPPRLDRGANHMLIPRGLLAAGRSTPPDGDAEEVDVLVVGSGVAGLSAALAVPPGRSVLLATKGRLGHSATRYAQGGIAAVLHLGGSGGLMERSGSPPEDRGSGGLMERSGSPPEDRGSGGLMERSGSPP